MHHVFGYCGVHAWWTLRHSASFIRSCCRWIRVLEKASHPIHSTWVVKNSPHLVGLVLFGLIIRPTLTCRGQRGAGTFCLRWESSAVLLQSGLDEKWWADSLECFDYLRNIQDLVSDGKTLYERRFGEPFRGPVIPFGAMVECHPISAKDLSRLHQFGKKVLPGIFLGYVLYAGGIRKKTFLSQTLRNWKRWTQQNSTHEGSTQRKC